MNKWAATSITQVLWEIQIIWIYQLKLVIKIQIESKNKEKNAQNQY